MSPQPRKSWRGWSSLLGSVKTPTAPHFKSDINLPWSTEHNEYYLSVGLSFGPALVTEWLILDRLHVVIGCFDNEEQADACVWGANLRSPDHVW